MPQFRTQPRSRRRGRRTAAHPFALISAVGAVIGALAFAGPAAAAVEWDDSETEFSIITGCLTGEIEAGLGAYVGYLREPSTPPRTGEVFYGRTVAAVSGNSCAGHAVRFEVTPPPGVRIAISAANPVVCLTRELDGASTPIAAERCPQVTSAPLYGGAVAFDPADQGNDPTWDIARKQVIEIQFPMVASGPLLGAGAFPCDCLRAYTKVIDTSENPVLVPKIAVVVAGGSPAPTPGPSPAPSPVGSASGGMTAAKPRSAGKCASLKGKKRSRCIKTSCRKLRGKRKQACVAKVTRKKVTRKKVTPKP